MSDRLRAVHASQRSRERPFESVDQNLAARRERRMRVLARVTARTQRIQRPSALPVPRIFSWRHRRWLGRVASNRLDRPRREIDSTTRRIRHDYKTVVTADYADEPNSNCSGGSMTAALFFPI